MKDDDLNRRLVSTFLIDDKNGHDVYQDLNRHLVSTFLIDDKNAHDVSQDLGQRKRHRTKVQIQ